MPWLVLAPVALLATVLLLGFVGCTSTSTAPYTRYTDDTILLNAGPSGLVAYWPLGESAGTVAVARYGSYTGTYTSAPLALGQSGIVSGDAVQPGNDSNILTTCMEVAGGYVEVPHSPSLNPPRTVGFTIEAWVWVGQTNSGTDRTVIASHDPNTHTGYLLLANQNNMWEFRVEQGGTLFPPVSVASQPVQPGTTTHLVAVYENNDTLRLYVDAWDDGPVSVSPGLDTNLSVPFIIGADHNGQNPFIGKIQDVAVYSGALSANDISTHHQHGNGMA